jgi:hypothetical protein
MIDFLLLMAIPVLISIGYLVWEHYEDGYDLIDLLKDVGVQVGVVSLVVALGLGIAYWQRTSDREIWNGQVTGKASVQVSCRHSYPCNCRQVCSGSGKNESCSTVCDTCYEHSYDIDWDVHASTGETVTIDTIDRQGLQMPPRWGAAYTGEPFSSEHRFTNYILANPSSVLLGQKGDMKKFRSMIPVYPEVYDYYKTTHFINAGVLSAHDQEWNYLLSMANRGLGPSKQVNLIVVAVPTDDPAYMYAFRDAWVGGKKNDAIILIGSKDSHEIDWVGVVSWTPNKEYNIYVRDRILNEKYLDHRDAIVSIIADETANRFQRMHMKSMEWLVRSFQPSGTAMLWILLFGVLASAGACFGSHQLREGGYY